ncbi:MAG: NAD-dependent epimerase/dehydratase family protein, partial [Hyphomonadaceae bacterium]|nr:NAD-dependent epimerase/dehydratase family protein [Hyphomonadaceae bacterium]
MMPVIGSKFVVVGGAGLVGSAVVRALSASGADVIVCDQVPDSQWHQLPPGLDDVWSPEDLWRRLEESWRD